MIEGIIPSLIANAITNLTSGKDASLDESMSNTFRNALWEWNPDKADPEIAEKIITYRDMLPYVSDPSVERHPDIDRLLALWKNEMFKDPVCNAAYKDIQLTQMHKDVLEIKKTTGQEVKSESLEELHRQKDIKTITKLINAFSFDLLDEYCREVNWIKDLVVCCYDVWNEILSSSSFKIHDPELQKVILAFFTKWKEAIDLGTSWYSPCGTPGRYTFHGLQADIFTSERAEQAFNKLTQLHIDLQPRLKAMSDYIQSNYPIDIESCSLTFFRKKS